MFRTFCSNPSLGGFGSESSAPFARTSDREGDDDDRNAATPDAFCQIIKELVDNAVDACCAVSSNTETVLFTAPKKPPNGQCGAPTTCAPASSRNSAKRVRIVIETFQDKSSSSSSSSQAISTDSIGAKRQKGEILRVTVSDNGCGMDDIQACVGAFHSSKGQHSASQRPTRTGAIPTGKSQKTNISKTTNTTTTKKSTLHRHPSPSEDVSSPPEAQTAGRYGIGLTLCLLHAQRLVPDSCASIQSATMLDAQWAVVAAVVDMASDAVRCLPRPSLAKGYAQESGTAISVLVPVRKKV